MLRLRLVLLLVPTLAGSLQAQDALELDDLIDQGRKFIEENLDERVTQLIQGLEAGDRAQVQRLLAELQQEFGAEYVLDLPRLQKIAQALLPVLAADESTAPYAAWLRSRMDYFDVARELATNTAAVRPSTPAGRTNAAGIVTVQVGTNAPSVISRHLPNPAAPVQRAAWERRTAARGIPAAATRYVDRLKPVFAAFGVPEELVWVAEVESSFEPRARSPAGAVGLFQLMPQTARGLGLSIIPSDEREHPEKSARAAAAYLKGLHDRFQDWRLALAAYNAGENRLQRLMQQHRVKSFDDVSPFLPAETQLYVPKVEGVIWRREGRRLGDLRGG